MENKEKKSYKTKFFAIGSGVIALASIIAIVIILLSRSMNKTQTYSATFIANTDPNRNGRIQGSESKTFDNITKLDAPYSTDVLPSYTFDYWCSDAELTKPVEFPYNLTKNENFYAHWSMQQSLTYKVTFNTDGGSIVGETSVTKGESISRPEANKPHCELKAWHENNIQGKEVFKKISENEYEKYTPTGNVVLCAEWIQTEFNVGLDPDGGAFGTQDTLKDITIGGVPYKGYEYTKSLSSAPSPTKEGYSFQGWYTDISFNDESFVTFPLEIKSDMVLHAKWVEVGTLPTLTIDANGGYLPPISGETEEPHSRNIKTNLLPYSPTAYYLKDYKDQYNLLGWYDVNDKKVNFPLSITTDTTIKAKWERVRFNANIYGTEKDISKKRELNHWNNIALCRYADIPTPEQGDKDLTKIPESSSASKINNYTLEEWEIYSVQNGEEAYVGKGVAGGLDITPLTYDAHIYAKWKQNKFNITLHNGTTKKLLEAQTKETIGTSGPNVPDGWVKSHEVFSGWYSDPECKNKINFNEYQLTKDDDFYTIPTLAQGKVYLHTSYDKTSATYNGTEDYYYTEDFKDLGAGFAARDLPDKEHYKKLGWTFTESDYIGEFPDPSGSNIIYSKTATEVKGKIKPWPSDGIRPKAGKIAHLYPTYEQSQFEIKFNVGEKATACNSIWTKDKGTDGKAYIPSEKEIPDTSKAFSEFKGWSLTEGGNVISKDDLKKYPFTKDTTLYAVFKTNAWTVNFNVLTGSLSYDKYTHIDTQLEGITQLSSGTLSDMTNYVSGKSEYDRTKSMIAGWSSTKPTSDADTYDISKISTSFNIEKDTELYAIYNKTDVEITIDLNGASVGGSTETQTIETTSGIVTSAEVWKDILAKKGTISAPSNLPNFVGWSLNGNLIEYPYTLEASSKLSIKMIWANTRQFMVTFNANNGDFYYKTAGVTKTTPLVSYTVDLDSTYWKDKSPTLANVYEKARIELGGLDSSEYLLRDGYTLKANKFTMNGIEISDSYVINSSSGFTANWEAKGSTGDWFSDSLSTIASYATSENALKTQYKNAYEGTKANVDNSRTKDANTLLGLEVKIKIPTLSSTLNYHIRVIGVGQDSIVGSESTKKKACLTFEFIDAPIFGCYAPDGSGRDARYDKSTIRNSTLPYLLNTLPSSMTSLFKTVYKPYLTSTSSSKSLDCTTVATDETSLFILSAYEYGGSTNGSAYVENSNISSYKFAYKYYYSNSSSVIGDGTSSKRYHYIPDTTTITPNWTRTPYNSKITKGLTDYDICFLSATSSKEGSMLDYDPMSGYGICPAFCIGTIS